VEHLRPLWGLTEGQLKSAAIKAHLWSLLEADDGRPALSAATVNKVLGTARRIIREAQANDKWGGKNPFALVDRLKQVRPETRCLSLAEARALLPHLRGDRRRQVLTMLYLGLRPGELKALQKSDIDMKGRAVTVRRSNGRDSTKTGKVRHVPVPDALWPHLEAAIADSPEDCKLVFPSDCGERQRADAKLSRALRAALGKAGVCDAWKYICRRQGCGYRKEAREQLNECGQCPRCGFTLWEEPVPPMVRFYDLRHSAATLHRESGSDPLAIQVALGHAAENLTDSVYTHLSMDYLRRELNKLKI
jgi:integrase